MEERYPEEVLNDTEHEWEHEDNGTMPENVDTLRQAVVGHRIVSAERREAPDQWGWTHEAFVLTLDNGKQVALHNTHDCCAYTGLEAFWLDPSAVDHVIMGVGTTGKYTTWHVYADYGDILRLTVGWSAGNPFYYGYGFDISVSDLAPAA